MEKWTPFEHRIWRNLTESSLQDRKYLLAVSGGVDSVVLLNIMLRIRPQAEFKVVHFHHGPSSDENIKKFRDRSLALVEKIAGEFNGSNVRFFSGISAFELKSEEEFRDARWTFIRETASIDDVILTAHHLDDRIETVMLKLIRGTSVDGLRSFSQWNGKVFRPLLSISKAEIEHYALEQKLVWEDDPSNADPTYLRNWLREVWLYDLEKRVPGGRANLAKSILRVIENSTDSQRFSDSLAENIRQNEINRVWYSLLSKNEQLRTLGFFLKSCGIFEITTGQLEELRKRLDKNQKDLTFDLFGRKWVINASQIVIV